jgi:hypothetical protein
VARVGGLASSKITLPKLESRAITAEFHGADVERIVGRTWAAKENHVVVLEVTQ